jgi:transcriptional regulator with XRE-family HTH domain
MVSGPAGTGVRRAALGTRLVRLRTEAGLGAAELATAAGLDPADYRDVEAGRGELTYLDLFRLADALDVSPARVLADQAAAPTRPGRTSGG